MKRLLTILFIAFSMGLFAQTGEIKPITCKALQTPNNATFYFNPPDTTLRISMGSYGILEIAGAKRYQRKLKITTTGTSGASTLIDGTLNIPQYSGDSTNYVQVSPSSAQSGNIWMNGAIGGTTAKLTNLTDGYLPYHISDASGLGNSPIYTDGTNIGIGTTTPKAIAHIGTVNSDTIPFLATGTNTYGWGMFYENTNGDLWIKPQVLGNYGNGVTIQRSSGNIGIGCLSGTKTRLAIIHADGTFGIIADGTNGQVLGTDGSGGYSWVDQTGGGANYAPSQYLTSAVNLTIDYSLGYNVVLVMTMNITAITFLNIPDGLQGDILVIENSTGGYGIDAISQSGLTTVYPDINGDNIGDYPNAANINSGANRKSVISFHRVGTYLLITYGNYAQ